MPVRTGAQYLQRLKEHNPEVWLESERIRDVTSHPALRRGARSVAHLYDDDRRARGGGFYHS